MIYEERRYRIAPGKMPNILRRFEDHALRLFQKHGIELVGFWTPAIGPSLNEVCYLVKFDTVDKMRRAWDAMAADPEWIAIKAETERDGPLVLDIANRILRPAAFSPLA
ncbi:MAG TPA: NIPSNAP family protein [Propylenella sp.]|jgi:hypothetical protein